MHNSLGAPRPCRFNETRTLRLRAFRPAYEWVWNRSPSGNDPSSLSLLPLFSFYIAVVFHPVVFSSIRKMEIFFSKLFIPFIPCFSFFIFARYFRIIIPRYGNIFVKFSRLFSFNEKTFRFSFYSNRIEKWKYFVIYFPSSDSNTIKGSLLFPS